METRAPALRLGREVRRDETRRSALTALKKLAWLPRYRRLRKAPLCMDSLYMKAHLASAEDLERARICIAFGTYLLYRYIAA